MERETTRSPTGAAASCHSGCTETQIGENTTRPGQLLQVRIQIHKGAMLAKDLEPYSQSCMHLVREGAELCAKTLVSEVIESSLILDNKVNDTWNKIKERKNVHLVYGSGTRCRMLDRESRF